MTDKELKRELYNYVTKQCSAVSINMEHRLVYHYDQMEKVGEFIYNLEEKRIAELEKENTELKIFNNALTIQYEQDISELKVQIEKMKPYCKKLCKNYRELLFMNNDCINGVCRNCNKWELVK